MKAEAGAAAVGKMDATPATEVIDLAASYWKSAALSAAVELGVFDALARAPADAASLAGHLGAPSQSLAPLLDALAGLGLLSKEDGCYRIAPPLEPLLDPESERSLLPALRLNAELYQLWGRLAACVRSGAPVVPESAHLGPDEARTRRFVLGMHSRGAALAPDVVPHLELGGARSLLDVGAGAGTFSRMLARQNAQLQVTLLDLPPVLNIAAELAAADPAAGRIAFHPADYRRDQLPAGFDAVLFSGSLHQETRASAAALFSKMHEALRPGGRLFVLDFMLEPDRTQPAFAALFALNMMLVSSTARVYSGEETAALAAEAGFVQIECGPAARTPFWIVSARKPRDQA